MKSPRETQTGKLLCPLPQKLRGSMTRIVERSKAAVAKENELTQHEAALERKADSLRQQIERVLLEGSNSTLLATYRSELEAVGILQSGFPVRFLESKAELVACRDTIRGLLSLVLNRERVVFRDVIAEKLQPFCNNVSEAQNLADQCPAVAQYAYYASGAWLNDGDDDLAALGKGMASLVAIMAGRTPFVWQPLP
jgi:hypothetical protein